MKTRTFMLAFMLGVASFVGCSKEDGEDDNTQQPEELVTYEVTYTMSASDDFFSAGTVMVSYIDADGKDQSEILERSDMPFSVTLEGLEESDLIYFDVAFGKQTAITDADLTKDTYTIALDAAYSVVGSNDKGKSGTITDSSMTLAKGKVLDYLDLLMGHEYGVAEKKISDLFE